MPSLILVRLLIKKLQNLLQDGIANLDSNLITSAIGLLGSLQPSLRYALDNQLADVLSTLCFVEDVIDTFIARIKLEKHVPTRRRWRDVCSSTSRGSHNLVFLNQMKTFISQLRNKEIESVVYVSDTAARSLSEAVHLKRVQHCWERISGSCLKEDAIDFLEHEQREHLDDFLKDGRSQVIILTGGAESGKTTLAKLVYNRLDVVRRFQVQRYWVCASEIYKFRDVMAEFLKQVNPDAQEPILETTVLQILVLAKLAK